VSTLRTEVNVARIPADVLEYRMPNAMLALLDVVVLRRRVQG